MAIIINKHGHRLEDFEPISSLDELKSYSGIDGGHAIVFYESKIVVCYNKYRNNWELPGGGKDANEDIMNCVLREISEETGQSAVELKPKGISTVFIPRMGKSILWAVFTACLASLKPFTTNEEMCNMILWDLHEDIGDFDVVDRKIINLAINL